VSTNAGNANRTVDTADFLQTLEILRYYPHSPPTAGAQQQGSANASAVQPQFSGRRVLTIVGWAFAIFLWLFVFCMLLGTRQPLLGLLLVCGPLAALLFRRRLRRKRATRAPDCDFVSDSSPEPASTASCGPLEPIASDDPIRQWLAVTAGSGQESEPAADVFPLRPATPPVSPGPASVGRRCLLFGVSLTVYAAFAMAALPDLTTTWIVVTVLLHEMGHFVAMFLRGYSNLNMFFIPFIAGAVTGTKPDATAADQLIMLLAGPAPGLLSGCLLYWLDTQQPLPEARPFALWLVVLNLLNLLPIWPLDGGRIGWILFARQSAVAQACLSACSFVGLCFLLLMPQGGTTFFVVMGLLLIWWLPARYRHARSALLFCSQYPTACTDLKQLSAQQLWSLYRLAPPAQPGDSRARAMQMLQIHSRVALLPRSAAQLRYLLAFVLLWMIALATAAGTSLRNDARDTSAAMGTLFDSLIPG
jgi:Zn-dependent protease